ncbi:MAG: threonylcarbamoyl-AMP synthase [Bacteroidetes bacterium]|nr:MAG: threonylcarbamoyl-AMP synthase [Bacteroidota bacterium]
MSVQQAIEVLRAGGVILHPTDTIPGLAADALQPAAIQKIYDIKGREPGKPLLLLCQDLEMTAQYVAHIPPHARKLVSQFPQLPLTLIYPQAQNLPANLLPPNGSVGIRIPAHAPTQQLLKGLGRPLASTSANLSGQPSPTSMANIDVRVLKLVDYVLNLPAVETQADAVASWVLTIEESGFNIIRQGVQHPPLLQWLKKQSY